MSFIKRLSKLLAICTLTFVLYLLFWPVSFEPKTWQAPTLGTPLTPVTATLKRASNDVGLGPEDIELRQGNLYTGTKNGDIIRHSLHTGNTKILGNTGGRPLTVFPIAQESQLIIADAKLGLLSMDSNTGKIDVLFDEYQGNKLKFVDHLDISDEGIAYFSDATQRWGIDHAKEDIIEHHKTGRIFSYNLATKAVTVVLDDLQFANGVALSKAQDYLLVNETGEYRVHKVWLKGPRKGQHDVLLENLPGMPDNISHHANNRFWVALFTPRNAILDSTADKPFVRKMMYRLPAFMQPQPKHEAMALEIDGDTGTIQRLVHIIGTPNYAPVTDIEVLNDNTLIAGSLEDKGLAIITLSESAATPSTK